MRQLVKVKDFDHLVKDVETGAILNTDKAVIDRHNIKMKEIEREKRMESEINNIKSEMSEIKVLLQKLING